MLAYLSMFFHESLPNDTAVVHVHEALTNMIVENGWIWGLSRPCKDAKSMVRYRQQSILVAGPSL